MRQKQNKNTTRQKQPPHIAREIKLVIFQTMKPEKLLDNSHT